MTTTTGPAGAQVAAPAAHVLADADAVAGDLVRALREVESIIRGATAWRTELLDAARRVVERTPEAVLASELEPDVWASQQGAGLAQRALVADVATTLAVHERTAARLFDEAEVLVNGLPATVAAMRAGAVSYRHAQALVEHTADLDRTDRAEIEAAMLPVASAMPPGAFLRRVGRARERLLAEPITVRHERAASHRHVRVVPARDGMAFLTAYLPATTACAVADRLDRAVDVLRAPDEPRTADQVRADVFSALLLDDGTLDHGLLALGTLAESATDAAACGAPGTGASATGAPGALPSGALPSGIPASGTATSGAGPVREFGEVVPGTGPAVGPSARQLVERLRALPPDPDDSPERILATRATMARLVRGIAPRVTVTVPALTLLRALGSRGDPPSTGASPGGAEPPHDTKPPHDTDLPGDADPPRDAEPSCDADLPPVHGPRVGSAGEAEHSDPSRFDTAYLDGYGPIDDHTATILAARAPSFRRLLTHPHTGAALAVGGESYVVPADLRAFLRLRDETCRFPGCSRRADRCDVDHTVADVVGGPTDAANLAHLCRTHHRLKHGTRWEVRQVGVDGTLVWTAPSGREHTTRPAIALDGGDPPPF